MLMKPWQGRFASSGELTDQEVLRLFEILKPLDAGKTPCDTAAIPMNVATPWILCEDVLSSVTGEELKAAGFLQPEKGAQLWSYMKSLDKLRRLGIANGMDTKDVFF